MEIRIQANDQFIGEIQDRTNISKASDITREAIEMFNWATIQAQEGRQIVAVDQSGNQNVWPIADIMSKAARW